MALLAVWEERLVAILSPAPSEKSLGQLAFAFDEVMKGQMAIHSLPVIYPSVFRDLAKFTKLVKIAGL
ncbi:MAG: hypothetical protein KDB03_02605 [Planctomycetales bacterium]|nr:hypothetical protein [Planctomycetales bacterium]